MAVDSLTAVDHEVIPSRRFLEILKKENPYYISEKDAVKVRGVNFTGDFDFFYFQHSYVEFESCMFSDKVSFLNKGPKRIKFLNCIFGKEVNFTSGEYVEIEFRGGAAEHALFVTGGTYKYFRLSMTCRQFVVHNAKFQDLVIYGYGGEEPLVISNLSFGFSNISGNIEITNIETDNFHMAGMLNKDTEVLISELYFTRLLIKSLYNNGRLRLSNLLPVAHHARPPELLLINSTLSKVEIFGVDIRKLGEMTIRGCYLIDTTFVNVVWPKALNALENDVSLADRLDRKEMYRQLKHAYSKQGDMILEHKFHGLEMDTFRDYLYKHRPFRPTTWLILLLSKWTSNYGQSIVRPVFFLLLSGVVLFTIMVALKAIPGISLSASHSLIQVLDTTPRMLWFINPLRKYEFEDINWGLPVDFLMRIISSYCIYNFIRATRRFVR